MYDWAELRHFRYLLSILEKQGFRVAAEELRTSQPNLTVQARQFQDNASIRLFRRLRNGRIKPTDTGMAFIALARLLLETRDQVIDALVAIDRGEIGSVRLGSAPEVDQDLFRTLCALHREILPACSVRPTHGDTAHLAEEVARGSADAAIVTLPLEHPQLNIEEIQRDRLVVCLRRDNALANRVALTPSDLQKYLSVLHHPQRHPDAHKRLIEQLASVGVFVREYSHASHPTEMQTLVKEGHGFALTREGTILDEDLTTRPITGVDWTVSTAVIYHKQRHPKTIPVVIKQLKKQFSDGLKQVVSEAQALGPHVAARVQRIPPRPEGTSPVQLSLLNRELPRDGKG